MFARSIPFLEEMHLHNWSHLGADLAPALLPAWPSLRVLTLAHCRGPLFHRLQFVEPPSLPESRRSSGLSDGVRRGDGGSVGDYGGGHDDVVLAASLPSLLGEGPTDHERAMGPVDATEEYAEAEGSGSEDEDTEKV